MTIKTKEGTVTAPVAMLNILSYGYNSLALDYEEMGCPMTANELYCVGRQIHEELRKTGCYGDSSKSVIKGYYKIDQLTKDGVLYELWNSEKYGEDVAALVVRADTGAVIGTTFDSLADFLNDLD